jgi:hypothetical protein
MDLNWVVDYAENRLTFEIDNLKYTTVDGGQNIYKHVDGVETTRIRQFPNEAEDYIAPMQSPPVDSPQDEWPDELHWLVATYPEELGEDLHESTIRQFQMRDGSFKTFDFMPGMGPNNREDRIMVNRMGIPASVQERWDWDQIGESDEPQPDSMFGTVWLKHKTTNEIIRAGAAQCVPCHVFPKVLKPVVIELEDLEQDVQDFGGILTVSL